MESWLRCRDETGQPPQFSNPLRGCHFANDKKQHSATRMIDWDPTLGILHTYTYHVTCLRAPTKHITNNNRVNWPKPQFVGPSVGLSGCEQCKCNRTKQHLANISATDVTPHCIAARVLRMTQTRTRSHIINVVLRPRPSRARACRHVHVLVH